ncbi:outer membrane protein assembly factor BamE [Minwuia sp.]|uniref:outer membrane protein assembly factor BamE n=1 Tax=Minwuia sp. TaxID=2493630 RepID=UPI003A9593DE
MIRSVLILISLLCVLTAQACTPTKITRGHHLEPEDLARIQPGVTTQQQVSDILGSPSSVATFKSHADIWYYISKKSERYTELDESTVDQQVVAITFDPQGRVEEMKNYNLDDARDISYVSRETPTQGAKLGFFEQLFNSLLGGGLGSGG